MPGMSEFWSVDLDYPVRPAVRWGHGRDPLAGVAELIDQGRPRYEAVLRLCLDHRARFSGISRTYQAEHLPYWECGWLSPLDLVVLYTLIAHHRPSVYIEVGSGCSTTFVRRAIDDGNLDTHVVSIDPEPRADIDRISDEIIRTPLEDTDLGLFDQLGPGDVVFIDGSHRSFPNSDATVAVLEVLPRLPVGVIVGFDDIYLPADYPAEWANRFYSEQYLLAAWLLGGGRGLELIAPDAFISEDPSLSAVLAPLWADPVFDGLGRDGNSFWMQRVE